MGEDRQAVWDQFSPIDTSDVLRGFGCKVGLRGEFYITLDGSLDAMIC